MYGKRRDNTLSPSQIKRHVILGPPISKSSLRPCRHRTRDRLGFWNFTPRRCWTTLTVVIRLQNLLSPPLPPQKKTRAEEITESDTNCHHPWPPVIHRRHEIDAMIDTGEIWIEGFPFPEFYVFILFIACARVPST
jgi:hypothetical protein